MTVTEVAQNCNVQINTVRTWIRKGYLKATRIGEPPHGRLQIDEQDYKNFIHSDDFHGPTNKNHSDIPFKSIALLDDCYPINLLRSVLGIQDWEEDSEPFDPFDYDIRHFRTLINTLYDRDQRVLQLRYQHGMTLDEVGQVMGLTRERVRMIQAKAERKLRHRIATGGCKVVHYDTYEKLRNEYNDLKVRYISMQEAMNNARIEAPKEEPKPTNVYGIRDISAVQLEDLEMNLTVRIYNCLKRAEINTFGDILYFDQHQGQKDNPFRYESWIHIRNFGIHSLKEFATLMYNFCGYRLHCYDPEKKNYDRLVPLSLLDAKTEEEVLV